MAKHCEPWAELYNVLFGVLVRRLVANHQREVKKPRSVIKLFLCTLGAYPFSNTSVYGLYSTVFCVLRDVGLFIFCGCTFLKGIYSPFVALKHVVSVSL